MCDVLVVDDDAMVLEMVVEMLRDAGLIVVEASNSRDALARFDLDDKPRVLVTDVDLGELTDGRDVARQARQASPGLPVIFITGRPDRFLGVRLKDRERLIPKPFRAEALLSAVRQAGMLGRV